MSDYRFSKGEYGFTLTETIQNNDGTVKDLTGYTVHFVMKDSVLGTNKVNSAATVASDPTTGVVTYTIVLTDFSLVGTYIASWILTKTGIQEETTQFTITIQPSAGP